MDAGGLNAYLAEIDTALSRYIDPAHMTYLEYYLGRADALVSQAWLAGPGPMPQAALEDLRRAAQVYAEHGGIFLTRWPHEALRRRRLKPLELALIFARDAHGLDDEALVESLTASFTAEVLVAFAGMADEEAQAEFRALSPFLADEAPRDAVDVAGALGLTYWFGMSALLQADRMAYAVTLKQAQLWLNHRAAAYPPEALGRMGHIYQVLLVLGRLSAGRLSAGEAGEQKAVTPEAPAEDGGPNEDVKRAFLAALHALHQAHLDGWRQEGSPVGAGAIDTTGLALVAMAEGLGLSLNPEVELPETLRWR